LNLRGRWPARARLAGGESLPSGRLREAMPIPDCSPTVVAL
jgi:hypothetical protein